MSPCACGLLPFGLTSDGVYVWDRWKSLKNPDWHAWFQEQPEAVPPTRMVAKGGVHHSETSWTLKPPAKTNGEQAHKMGGNDPFLKASLRVQVGNGEEVAGDRRHKTPATLDASHEKRDMHPRL